MSRGAAATRAWWLVGGALVLGQLLLPEGAGRDLVYVLLGTGAAAMVWWGVRQREAQPRRPWGILACGLTVWAVGDVLWALGGHIEGGEAFPKATDAFYLAGYALFTLALFEIARARQARVEPDAVIDGLIIGTVVTLVLYVFFLSPAWEQAGAVPIDRFTTIAYLVFDVLVVIQVAYLSRVERPRRPGLVLAAIAFLTIFLGDVLQTMVLRFPAGLPDGMDGIPTEAVPIHSWWLIAYLLLGAAPRYRLMASPVAGRASGAAVAGVPGAAVADDDGPAGPDGAVRPITIQQIALLGIALALVPLVPALQFGLGVPVTADASIAAAIVVIALVCLRLGVAASRMREQAERLAHAAATDGLTGLATGRHFRAVLGERAAACRQHPVLVLFVSLDRLTEITDTLGYRVGDELLRAAADRVRAVVGPGGTAARLGGDSFAVVVDAGFVRHVDALEWAARLREALTATFVLSDVSVSVDAIVGVAVGPDDGVDGAELLQRADVAMSAARSRPEGVARYTGRMTSGGALTPHLMSELSRALEDGEIVVHYQPQVDVGTGVVRGVEALVRWQHPALGLLPPAAFIPAAERTGLIRPLTLHVLDQVMAQAVTWRDAGTHLRVAANLSVRDLLDPGFALRVADLLERYGLPSEVLELELTESMALVDPQRSLEVLRALAGLGVTLSIDDFGTGYSSLAHLQRLPVHRLKIDKSFVSRLGEDTASAAIVRSTIELARNLGMSVVAEGVEDDATLIGLRRLRCDLAQGFGLARPVPAEQLPGVVAAIEARVPALLRGLHGGPGLHGTRRGRTA